MILGVVVFGAVHGEAVSSVCVVDGVGLVDRVVSGNIALGSVVLDVASSFVIEPNALDGGL